MKNNKSSSIDNICFVCEEKIEDWTSEAEFVLYDKKLEFSDRVIQFHNDCVDLEIEEKDNYSLVEFTCCLCEKLMPRKVYYTNKSGVYADLRYRDRYYYRICYDCYWKDIGWKIE